MTVLFVGKTFICLFSTFISQKEIGATHCQGCDVKAKRIVTPAESPDSELQHRTKAVMSRQAAGLPVAVSKVETLW